MENTLLIGDHLLVDHITFSPATRWMPLVHHRDPQRGDIVVFFRPAPRARTRCGRQTRLSHPGKAPGWNAWRSHPSARRNSLHQWRRPANAEGGRDTPVVPPSERAYEDEFPSVLPTVEDSHGAVTPWVVDLPNHIEDGDLVVPPGKYFMMGDHRHASLDSRFWGFVPRENILGRPLFNYWSFKTPEDQEDKKGLGNQAPGLGMWRCAFSQTRGGRAPFIACVSWRAPLTL